MNINYDFVEKTISISCDTHGEMDNIRILLKTIKDYGKTLDGISDYDLSLQNVIDTVAKSEVES